MKITFRADPGPTDTTVNIDGWIGPGDAARVIRLLNHWFGARENADWLSDLTELRPNSASDEYVMKRAANAADAPYDEDTCRRYPWAASARIEFLKQRLRDHGIKDKD